MTLEQKKQVLELLAQGSITVDEALSLLEALEGEQELDSTHVSSIHINEHSNRLHLKDKVIAIDAVLKEKMNVLKDTLSHVKTHVDDIKNHTHIIIEKKRKKA